MPIHAIFFVCDFKRKNSIRPDRVFVEQCINILNCYSNQNMYLITIYNLNVVYNSYIISLWHDFILYLMADIKQNCVSIVIKDFK